VRITSNMITDRVMSNLQTNFRNVATLQEALTTGRKFRLPGDNPAGYAKALSLRSELSENRRYQRNIGLGQTTAELTESTLSTITDGLQRARELAVQGANDSYPPESRAAIADEISQIMEDVIELANSNFEGTFLFSGTRTLHTPFSGITTASGREGVRYGGDLGDRRFEINQNEFLPVNLDGITAFFSSRGEVRSSVAVTPDALLATELTGIAPPLVPVAGDFTVDGVTISFDPATDTLESLRDSINRSVTTAEALINENGQLEIKSLTSENVELANGTSNVLEALDLFHRAEGGAIGAGITSATTLASLGVTGDALLISAGEDEFRIDLAGATTVGDLITAVGASGGPFEAFVNAAGTGISISATESLESFEVKSLRRIFGSTALAPGALTGDTTLASLGITTGTIEINNDGALTTVDLSAATTISELLDSINSQCQCGWNRYRSRI